METLGDILAAALKEKEAKMHYDVTLTNHGGSRKIADIKALREATRLPAANGSIGNTMGLTEAKTAIEHMYDHDTVVLRLSPERFAAFSYNLGRETYLDRDWSWKKTELHFPETKPAVFILD